MSRLLNNSTEYRESLEKRNLYTPNNEYDLNSDEMLKSISSLLPYINVTGVSKIIRPMEKIYDRIFNRTPIIEIGMHKLADQFLKNVANNVSRNIAEVVDLSSIIKNKNLSSIYTGLNYKITKVEANNTFQKIGNIIEEVVGTSPINKFEMNMSSGDDREKILIENTGTGQLNELMSNVNSNKFRMSSIIDNDTIKKNKYIHRYNKKVLFSDVDKYTIILIDEENFKESELTFDTYYPSAEDGDLSRSNFIKGLGETKEISINKNKDDIYSNYGFRDDVDDLIWGFNHNKYTNNKFGLLYHTSKLFDLNENVDLTRKIYKDRDTKSIISYNGGGLYEITEDSKKYNDKIVDGIRQHVFKEKKEDGTFEDSQYNKYAKLIRFNGNVKYDGNKNSVIYNTVIPKIAPNFNDTKIKNLMFTIENLAVKIKDKDIDNKVCYLEDDTMLPLSEAGINNGRVMWFAPYNISFREDVRVDRTSTSFIGRGENVYTYNNTERSGTLDFKMLIDTPPQLRSIISNGYDDYHKTVSQFFDFGGVSEVKYDNKNIKQIEDEINKIKLKLKDLVVTVNLIDENISSINPPYVVYFANDSYEFPITYEVDKGNNLNNTYDSNTDTSLYIGNLIDKLVVDYLISENEGYYDVVLNGNSSKLYLAPNGDKYNEELSKRRCNSVLDVIKASYKKIYGKDIGDKFNFIINSFGSKNAKQPNIVNNINDVEVKKERNVEIIFKRNTKQRTVLKKLSDEELEEKNDLERKLENLEVLLNNIKNQYRYDKNRFREITIDDKFISGFSGVEDKIFQNTFFSQTPEAFHRRLTFLHQCTRQGRNIDTETYNNSVFGRQPVQILRFGDFFHSKILIENVSFDYSQDNVWDLNPEGMGVQPMMVDISIKFIFIGGQSMETDISKLQNALSTNYYANSTFYNNALYEKANQEEFDEIKRRGWR